MKKEGLIFGVILVIGLAGFALAWLNVPQKLGIAVNEASYSDTQTTEASISCANASSTPILGRQPGRTSFTASNIFGVAPALLCKADVCSATSSIYLAPTSTTGVGIYVQTDGYIGKYSCIGYWGTSTINYSVSK